jgi:hypothetical protein
MSAWYVLSAMGFYPVSPGTDYYVTGSPLFDKVSIHLENGKTCMIEARNNSRENIYIQSASLNGEPLRSSYILHEDIMQGGHFIFEMGPEPNTAWGNGEGEVPITAISDHLITPAPYFIAESRTFSREMEIAMDCIDNEALIRYTLDGSEPGDESPLYTDPITLNENSEVKAFAISRGKTPSKVVEGTFSLMPEGRGVAYNTEYDPQYTAGGDKALIDLIRGSDNFRTGSWQGFHGVDVDIVVDLGKEMQTKMIGAGFLQDQGSWIFMPEWVEFSVSPDGEEWQALGREKNITDPKREGGIIRDFAVKTDDLPVRYIRVYARNRALCPEWHRGAGNPAWLFIDEVVVE